jgi:hypothetical protein
LARSLRRSVLALLLAAAAACLLAKPPRRQRSRRPPQPLPASGQELPPVSPTAQEQQAEHALAARGRQAQTDRASAGAARPLELQRQAAAGSARLGQGRLTSRPASLGRVQLQALAQAASLARLQAGWAVLAAAGEGAGAALPRVRAAGLPSSGPWALRLAVSVPLRASGWRASGQRRRRGRLACKRR